MTAKKTKSQPAPDIRAHSRLVVDGLKQTGARAMLRAVGFGDADFEKPQIGVASTWAKLTPCNMHIRELAEEARPGWTPPAEKASYSIRSPSPTASPWARPACATRSCRAR